MQALAIDIETTGLDPERNQILEIAAIPFDTHKQTEIRPSGYFHAIVKYEEIIGHPFALNMNKSLIEKLLGEDTPDMFEVFDAAARFQQWLRDLFFPRKIIVAGKNVAGFDIPFLIKQGFTDGTCFKHRTLDPTILYIEDDDDTPPDLGECYGRAVEAAANENRKLPDFIHHDAIADCMMVIHLFWEKFAPMGDWS